MDKDNTNEESSNTTNDQLLTERLRLKKIEILEIKIKMLNLQKDIAKINIDLLQNEKKNFLLENLDEKCLTNEYGDSTIVHKSVNLEKYINEKVDEFDRQKETILQLTDLQTSVKLKDQEKMSKLLSNEMDEDKLVHEKRSVENEEMSVINKCVLDNNDNCYRLISTLENEIQQIVEEFENECEQLHLPFNSI